MENLYFYVYSNRDRRLCQLSQRENQAAGLFTGFQMESLIRFSRPAVVSDVYHAVDGLSQVAQQ